MFGILVITHGKLSEGIVDASNMIFGPQNNLEALQLNPEDDVELLKDKILESYKKINTNHGVLILTDLMSASPFNQSTLAIHSLPEDEQEKVFVLTGVNLPMVLEAINQNLMQESIVTAVDKVKESGEKGIEKWSIQDVTLDDDDDF